MEFGLEQVLRDDDLAIFLFQISNSLQDITGISWAIGCNNGLLVELASVAEAELTWQRDFIALLLDLKNFSAAVKESYNSDVLSDPEFSALAFNTRASFNRVRIMVDHVDERNVLPILNVGDSVAGVDQQNDHEHLFRDLDHSLLKIIPGFLELIETLVNSLGLIFREFGFL